MTRTILLIAAAWALHGPCQAAEHRITMVGSTYKPAVIEANVGDTLIFDNDDTEAHEVFVPTVAFSTDLGKQDPGKPARLVLTRPGTFEVECVFHQHMLTRVVVKP
jgi:plastocyanin